mmetsp:Transcript_27443/g.26251  ORF Transcript_27443/g.26251 Transcript_27443/m.26251 type:complete len:295 (-) Transcript_27443:442-1326(-)
MSAMNMICIFMLLLQCPIYDTFLTKGNRITTFNRMEMMGAGFGSPKTKTTISNDKNENKIDKTLKGDGSSYIKHCVSLDRKFNKMKCIHSNPPIFEIDDFLSAKVCDEFIERTEKEGLAIPSQTFRAGSGSTRTSSTAYLPYSLVPELLDGVNRLTGFPITTFEEPQVVSYEIGQQFSWHLDSIPKSLQDSSGNRIATVIVYLNDVKSGGATCFKDLDIQVKPQKGKALLFFPSFADGSPDDRVMHAGQVAMDTKYITQIWIHERDYSPKTPVGTNHASGILAVKKYIEEKIQS